MTPGGVSLDVGLLVLRLRNNVIKSGRDENVVRALERQPYHA